MAIPNATLEVYKGLDNSITVHGVYYGSKASKFILARNQFDELVQHMLRHHDLTTYTGRIVHEYQNLWTYTVQLHAVSNQELIDDVVSWYQEMAANRFYTPEQFAAEKTYLVG